MMMITTDSFSFRNPNKLFSEIRGGNILKKKILLTFTFLFTVLLLTGCAAAEEEGRFFHDYFVFPFTYSIRTIGEFLGNNYGLAIIVITIILRTILLPLALNSAKKQKHMREKMEVMKPEMEEIQQRLKAAKNKEEQMKIQQEMMLLYQKHNFNPLAMGCLPMLLQIPIWMGLYYAIRISPEIAGHNFLWFTLESPDVIMAVIAAIMYYFQFKVSTYNMAPEMAQQMKFMGLLSPIMILIASLNMPSALAVYWAMSGLYLIGQTYLMKKLYPVNVTPLQTVATSGDQNKK